MARNRVIGWVVAHSKQEAIKTIETMLDSMKRCDDDVDWVNMHITEEDIYPRKNYTSYSEEKTGVPE